MNADIEHITYRIIHKYIECPLHFGAFGYVIYCNREERIDMEFDYSLNLSG